MNKKIRKLHLSNDPCILCREVLFNDNNETIKDKNKKQFVTTVESSLIVEFTDDTYIEIKAKEGYNFDGATIPFNIGKGNMKLLIPALFHDIMCDDKSTINYDRNLASKIFKEALIECKVNRVLAQYMYLNVEVYQKLCCNWRKPNE